MSFGTGFVVGVLFCILLWIAVHELDRRHCRALERENGHRRDR